MFFHLKTSSAAVAHSLLTLHVVLPSGFADTGLLGSLFDGVDRIASVSEATVKFVLAFVPGAAAEVSVLYSRIATPEVSPQPLPFDPPRILCVGRLVAGKSRDSILRSMPFPSSRRGFRAWSL